MEKKIVNIMFNTLVGITVGVVLLTLMFGEKLVMAMSYPDVLIWSERVDYIFIGLIVALLVGAGIVLRKNK